MRGAEAAPYQFGPTEQPTFQGGPYSPAHHPARRLAYLVVALIVGVSAQLGNALVTVNLANISGSLGVTLSDAIWLSSVYVAANASGNLLLVRARIRFGIPAVTLGLLSAYAAATIIQLTIPGFATALLVRMASGAVATGLTTITIYNLLQVVPPKARALALLVGVSIPQLAVPLARLFPVTMLTVGQWQGLHMVELSITLTVIALMLLVPLPPSIRGKGFEPLDLLTFTLAFPGLVLFCGAIGAGRYLWWTDTPWIGVALVVAIILFVLAFLVEHHRANPLLLTEWISSKDILRFAVIALLVRFSLAEQTYGAIGLLTAGGLNNDQLHTLFLCVLGAMVLGIITAIVTLSPTRIPKQVLVATLAIGLGAWLDSDATNLTRPTQLYVSQSLLGFGACFFIGPALLYGFGRVIQLGQNYLVSFLIVFSVSQNVGGLLGSSLLGTYQVMRAKAHAAALSEHLSAADPQVAARLAQQGSAGLYSALQREASVLAFNDIFRLVAVLALITAVYIAYLIVLARLRTSPPHSEGKRA
ncbi:MFS transporter [Sphingobium yanoikuyae]|uniref:MFS transporter n=1 Tax=Sphingobium yanoikuyae TaxID=13690 RepID=UPI0007A75516|nr:MFS transporter [Sphingobium yanoikuyae]KZC75988.1 MFS transporter [Sphingobium yanoikuyae]